MENSTQEILRKAAAEGAVLLKNDGDKQGRKVLPLLPQDNIAVFGRTQYDYYRSGTGSGGSVHVPYSTSLMDGFKRLKDLSLPCPSINEEVAAIYRSWIKENPFDDGGQVWAGEPWCQKEMEIGDDTARAAAEKSNKAIYIIGRTAGEDKDNAATEGSWLLTATERANLETLARHFDNVVIVLNVSNIISMDFLTDKKTCPKAAAVLYVWHGGMEGGNAAAEVLCGIENPSGKLTDTIAYDINDYPSTECFGDKKETFYKEDIFVGYRYFSTFASDKVQFPFGFGLSYTEFSIQGKSFEWKDGTVRASVSVRNTGDKRGKEVVQLYVRCPEGTVTKSSLVLCAAEKTSLLEPGQEETLFLECDEDVFASFDDTGDSGHKDCWILEAGEYTFLAGNDSMSAKPWKDKSGKASTQSLERTAVKKQCVEALTSEVPFKRLKAGKRQDGILAEKTYEDVPVRSYSIQERIEKNRSADIPYTGNKNIKFSMLKDDPALMDSFIAQLNDEELCTMVRGEGMMSRKATPGIAAAFGGVSEALHGYGIPVGGCSDGPSGIRMDTGKEASLGPIGTALACSWNPSLVRSVYQEIGDELIENGIDFLLGPGMNIHRSPLNGRNFEYFSEDPLVTAIMAGAVVKGLADEGVHGTIKHFASNNQETARHSNNSIMSQKAAREIYLKAFELVAKENVPMAVMTTYNALNGHWTGSNYDLVNTILRQEWGFEGLVMTDWWAALNDCDKGGNASVKNMAAMVHARNDVYMVVDNDCAQTGGFGDDLESALKDGSLTRGELQVCVKDILNSLLISPVASKSLGSLKNETRIQSEKERRADFEKLNTVNEGESFVPSDGKNDFMLYVDHDGVYNIAGIYLKDGGDTLSQSVCNIMMNDIPAASLECRSTNGRDAFVNAAQVVLEKGWYHVALVHTKAGITVKSISFSSEVVNPVTLGVVN